LFLPKIAKKAEPPSAQLHRLTTTTKGEKAQGGRVETQPKTALLFLVLDSVAVLPSKKTKPEYKNEKKYKPSVKSYTFSGLGFDPPPGRLPQVVRENLEP
jgi:hypothetical protein